MSHLKDYILLDIVVSSPLDDKVKVIKEGIRDRLKDFDIALIYPTHDNKCYIRVRNESIAKLKGYLKENPIDSIQFAKIKLAQVEDEDKIVCIMFQLGN